MKTNLFSVSLMLTGTLIACKKKENKPNLEPFLANTRWELVSFDGVIDGIETRQGNTISTRSQKVKFSRAQLAKNMREGFAETLNFQDPLLGTVPELGTVTEISYNSDMVMITSVYEQCYTVEDLLKKILTELGAGEAIKKDHNPAENVCEHSTYTTKLYVNVTGDELHYEKYWHRRESYYRGAISNEMVKIYKRGFTANISPALIYRKIN
jgi:hypothetical protein